MREAVVVAYGRSAIGKSPKGVLKDTRPEEYCAQVIKGVLAKMPANFDPEIINDLIIGGCPFYMSKSQYDYWKHTQLIIDVIEGHGGTFSLEGPEGKAFHTRSRVFTAAEMAELDEADRRPA